VLIKDLGILLGICLDICFGYFTSALAYICSSTDAAAYLGLMLIILISSAIANFAF